MTKPQGKRYTDEQKTAYCELAKFIGVGAAIRELGYPSYPVASMWLEQRGVEAKKIDIMSKAREFHQYYNVQDMVKVVDEAIAVVQNLYSTITTADEAMKLANAVSKLVQSHQVLEGKANSIIEKRETTQQDLEIIELLNQQKNINANTERTAEIEHVIEESAE